MAAIRRRPGVILPSAFCLTFLSGGASPGQPFAYCPSGAQCPGQPVIARRPGVAPGILAFRTAFGRAGDEAEQFAQGGGKGRQY